MPDLHEIFQGVLPIAAMGFSACLLLLLAAFLRCGRTLSLITAVLTLIAGGAANEEMAELLGVQSKTVEAYVQRLMDKLAVHTRAGLVGYARRLKL